MPIASSVFRRMQLASSLLLIALSTLSAETPRLSGVAVAPTKTIAIYCAPIEAGCPAWVQIDPGSGSPPARIPISKEPNGATELKLEKSSLLAGSSRISADGFTATSYSSEDLEARRPLWLARLGTISGRIKTTASPPNDAAIFVDEAKSRKVQRLPLQFDEGGEFRCPVPPGVYHLAVLLPHRAAVVKIGAVIEAGKAMDLGLLDPPPGGSARIVVVDDKTRKPVPGAEVTWDPSERSVDADILRALMADVWSARTGPDGVATIEGLTPMRVRWRIAAVGYLATESQDLEAEAGKVAKIPLVRLSRGVSLTVDFAFPTDLSIPRLSLLVLQHTSTPGAQRPYRMISRYAMDGRSPVVFHHLEPAEYRLELSEAGANRLLTSADITVGNRGANITLHVEPKHVVGCVTSDEAPVAGALVAAGEISSDRRYASTSTAEDGCYDLELFHSGPATVYAKRTGHGLAVVKAIDLSNSDRVLANFRLAGGRVFLAVSDRESGDPLPSARALIVFQPDISGGSESDSTGGATVAVKADKNGVIELDDLSGGTARVDLTARGHSPKSIEVRTDADLEEPQTVTLDNSRGVSGIVVDAFGTPVAGATISDYQGLGMNTAETDETGHFSLESVPSPIPLVFVTAPGLALSPTILSTEPGGDDVRITASWPSGSPLYFQREDGTPLVNVQVAAGFPGGYPFPAAAVAAVAAANGMWQKQIDATGTGGGSRLPQYLAPGLYRFYVIRQAGAGGVPEYFSVGDFDLPLSAPTPVVVRPPAQH